MLSKQSSNNILALKTKDENICTNCDRLMVPVISVLWGKIKMSSRKWI